LYLPHALFQKWLSVRTERAEMGLAIGDAGERPRNQVWHVHRFGRFNRVSQDIDLLVSSSWKSVGNVMATRSNCSALRARPNNAAAT
jgi:hypothetical protein